MFRISDHHQDSIIRGRNMVVVARSNSTIICLPLCRYSGIHGHERDFLKARLLVYSNDSTAPKKLLRCPWNPVQVQLESGRNMYSNVWINCEKPYTIHYSDVKVALLGNLTDEGRDTLKMAYLHTQDAMASPDRKKPGLLWLHVKIVFGYLWSITGLLNGDRHGERESD
jgi:hypothetical protein